tara:strand:+ start:127 stop:405 length:279 start_codon:yes stop_codon:yes gene_type:complete
MLNYLVFGIALIIFVTVIVITGKAISRGIEAKQNQKNVSDENVQNSNEEHIDNSESLSSSNLTNQLNELNKLKDQGALTDEEFKKAKEKILN